MEGRGERTESTRVKSNGRLCRTRRREYFTTKAAHALEASTGNNAVTSKLSEKLYIYCVSEKHHVLF